MNLVGYLNELYAEAHYPPLREISEASDGQLSYTTVYNVLFVNSGKCRWRTIYAVVRILGGDVDRAQELWKEARADVLNGRVDSVVNTTITREDIQQLTTAVGDLHDQINGLREELQADREKSM